MRRRQMRTRRWSGVRLTACSSAFHGGASATGPPSPADEEAPAPPGCCRCFKWKEWMRSGYVSAMHACGGRTNVSHALGSQRTSARLAGGFSRQGRDALSRELHSQASWRVKHDPRTDFGEHAAVGTCIGVQVP